MDRAHAAVVAGVHGLQHVERFGAAHLADDDAVGPHAQRVDHQVARRDPAAPFDVGRPRLHADHVLLIEDQLGRVLDRDDALGVGNHLGERAEQRRLAGAGAARDQDVLRGCARRASRNSSISGDSVPRFSRSSRRRRRRPKRRMEIVGPSIVTGGSVALTRLPSGSAQVGHRRRRVDAAARRARRCAR